MKPVRNPLGIVNPRERAREIDAAYARRWPGGCNCSRGGSAIFCDCQDLYPRREPVVEVEKSWSPYVDGTRGLGYM